MERIVFIDVAKAICIVLVVIGHYVPDEAPGWYVALHDVIYTFHMPLFMFASGYVYIATKRNVGYGTFIMKKVRRLMVPYFTTSVIVIALKLLSQGSMGVDNPVTAASFLRMFYMPEAGAFLWFIWALWWMFVIVPLFKTAKARFVLFVLSLVFHFIPVALPSVFCLAKFKTMLVYFMLGVVVYETRWLHTFVCAFRPLQAAVAATLFVTLNYISLTVGGEICIVIFLLPYVGIFFTLELSKWLSRGSVPAERNGWLAVAASSYIIYLFHTTFEGFAKAVFRKLPLDSGLWYVFVPEALTVIACGVVVPMLLYRFFRRNRVTRVLFGL